MVERNLAKVEVAGSSPVIRFFVFKRHMTKRRRAYKRRQEQTFPKLLTEYKLLKRDAQTVSLFLMCKGVWGDKGSFEKRKVILFMMKSSADRPDRAFRRLIAF